MDELQENSMEMTPERAARIQEILIRLYEDQYHCKIVRTKDNQKKEASA